MYKVGLVIQIFDRDPVLRLVPRKSQKPLRGLETPSGTWVVFFQLIAQPPTAL